MTPTRFHAFIAKASERKLSTIVASLAFFVVTSTFIWTTFFTDQKERDSVFTDMAAIATVDKPAAANIQPPPHKNNLQHTPKRTLTTQPLKRQEKPIKPLKNQVTLGKGALFIQVGAFKEIVHARISYEKMRKKYKRARIMPKGDYYAIWVGPVATRAEAERLKQYMYKHDKIKGFITSEK